MSSFLLDPDAVLDFAIDWTAWLADGETITDHTIVATTGITVDSSTEDAGIVTVWVSGAEAGGRRSATCRITTDQGRTDDRTIHFSVYER